MSIMVKNVSVGGDEIVSRWTAAHVLAIADAPLPQAPVIGADSAGPLLPDHDIWDLWPLQNPDGSVAEIAGGALWMVLSAPRQADPGMRHDIARTRLLFRSRDDWQDCGLLFPDDLNPGSREWSGSAFYDSQSGSVTAYFTAAGRRGEAASSFEQRLFQATGKLDLSGPLPAIGKWGKVGALVTNDGMHYVDLAKDQGRPGSIRGFRDPYWFRDPLDGHACILFTASQPGGTPDCSGVIGIARAKHESDQSGFDLMPAIVSADGVANEMERPHMLARDGLYYLFWSTQNSVFAAAGPKGPTGLYGMVGRSVTGPFEPLNGTGLVIANPIEEPRQAYCWQVLENLEVASFIDHWGLQGRDPANDPALNRAQFGGTIAPMLKIEIDGAATKLVGLA
jgi:levansucrase